MIEILLELKSAGHSVETLDKNGNPVMVVGYAGEKVLITAEFAYTYDNHGNWITKTTRAKLKLYGENIEKRSEFEIRTITYYP